MIAITLAGMALIMSLVALYYTNKASDLAHSIAHVLVSNGLVEVKYVDEEEDE